MQDLAALHTRFETIHPFHDGNGRTGQIILFRQSLKHSMIPVTVRDSQKPAYYAGL
ncbi:Fic family protein, partial [Faecalibaculum rodentium]|uniref:Fic family protein n=1 Tax=Faecalibaculum rodentium TaxID=1702221 RepID=UPI00339C4009